MINHINQFRFLTSQIIFYFSMCLSNFIGFLVIAMKFHLIFVLFRDILINYVNTTVNIAYFWSESSHINYIYFLLLVFLINTYSILTLLSHLQICSEIVTLVLNTIAFCIITHWCWCYLHISYNVNRCIDYIFQTNLHTFTVRANRLAIN